MPVDAGYHPGFTGGLLTGEERSCSWDTTELFNEGSLTVALYTAKDHVTHSTYPAGRTTDVAIDGASDAYAVAKTPYRIYFIKNGVSAQALYMPDYEGGEPDDTAEMAKFTTFVTQQVAAKL